MMKHSKMAKKSLSALLALVMLLSCFSGITLTASAAGESITVGELVADNYDLTDAEKALLSSGYLAGGSVEYTVPTDGDNLVTIDTENNKVTAKSVGEWKPNTPAVIEYSGNTLDVALSDDNSDGVYEGTYDPAVVGNAFSVKVEYELKKAIDGELQKQLLNTAEWLKQGVANLKVAYNATNANLGTVVMALDVLGELADGISMDVGFVLKAKFKEDAIAAVEALEVEAAENDGKLKLQTMNEAYNASQSKTEYLLENGADYKNVMVDTYNHLMAIKEDPLLNNDILDGYLEGSDPASHTAWMAFKNNLGNIVSGLENVVDEEWNAVKDGAGTNLVKSGITTVEYKELDELVAAIDEIRDGFSIMNALSVAKTTLQANASMFNVTVKVILNTVQDNNVIAQYGEKSTTLTLAENATQADILTAVDESGIVANAISAWGSAYVDEKYTASYSVLPDTLTADIEYTITYNPKTFNVTYSYAEAEQRPYGYVITLPVHADPAQSYDYKVNGTKYAQGSVITFTEDTNITRSSGKAYTNTDLYTVVANNYGNDVTKAILQSGAIKDNVTISVRKPDPADAGSLLALADDELTAQDYDASYNGLQWKPYTYGTNGTENEFSGNSADWNDISVKVQYKLTMTNFAVGEVEAILQLAEDLKSEANEQMSTLDSMAVYYATMGQLDLTKLGALNGVIDVTDFTPGDSDNTDAKNLELRAYFKELVSGIINNNLDSDGHLKLYNMLGAYKSGGLNYYYDNSAAVINEINTLSEALSGMMGEQEALEIMVGAAGFPEYAEKIENLEGIMASVKAALTAPNAKIDLESANLGNLIDALEANGDVDNQAAGYPYLISDTLLAKTADQVGIQVSVTVPVSSDSVASDSFTTVTVTVGEALTGDDIEAIKNAIEAFVKEKLGSDYENYFTLAKTIDLDSYVGVPINSDVNGEYTYTANTYTLKIDGVTFTDAITVYNRTVTLPAHETEGYVYYYIIDGNDYKQGAHTFSKEDLTNLFVDGVLNITRWEFDEATAEKEHKLEEMVANLNATGAGTYSLETNGVGEYTGIKADIAPGDLMDFAMGLVNSGYSYIGLNGEALVCLNEESTLEISIQTLINAILNDETFSNETIMALANDGNGKLLTASLQLGNDADDIAYEDLAFTINLTSVPGMITEKADMLESVFNIVNFNSNDGVLDISVTLPDQVYGAYLALLVATGELDKANVNELDNVEGSEKYAVQFLVDYLNKVLAIESLGSVQNTIDMLGADFDVSGYQGVYNFVKQNAKIGYGGGIYVGCEGKVAIDNLLSMLQIDAAEMETYLGMIKEYDETAQIQINAKIAEVTNADKDYNALVVDVNAAGMKDKFAVTSTADALNNKLAGITDMAAVILLDDVTGDLEIAGKTILDLNGKTITGDVTGTGSLYIIDSNMGTMDCGGIYGTVDGTVTIVAGKYNTDITAYLKDGYVQEDEVVSNALYIIEEDENGNITFVINSDVFEDESVEGYAPDTEALAIDIAGDLILNYFTAATLTVDGNKLYAMNFDDVVGMLDGTGKLESAVDAVLDGVDMAGGVSTFVNDVIADVLNFAKVETAIKGDGVIATYAATSSPWKIDFAEVNGYATVKVTANTENTKNFNISIKVAGDSAKTYVAPLLGELNRVVRTKDVTVALDQPTFAGTTLSNIGATVNVDIAVDLTMDYSDVGGFTQDDYIAMTAVILAYGNPDKSAAIATALNDGDMFTLKEIVDAMTVKDIFDSFKALSRNVSFASMANAVDADDVANAAELEKIYHLYLCGIGKALEEADIDGYGDRTMGALFDDETDAYVFEKENVDYSGSASAGNYTAEYEVMAQSVTVSVKLFGEVTPIPKYTVTVENGTITEVNGEPWDGTTVEFKAGTEITVKADDPDDGDRFAGWDVTASEFALDDATQAIVTFNMPAEDIILTANYEEIPAEQGWTAAPVVEEEWVYDGEPHITVPTANYGDVETIYEIEENGVYTSYTGTPVNVGKYRVTFRVPAGTYDGVACEELTAAFDFEITPRPISIADVITVGREYDGTNVVEISEVIFDNVVAGDDVGYTVESAVMADVNAGIGKNVTVNVTISNTNYSLAVATVNATVDIAKVQRDNQTGEQSVKYGNSITIDSVYDVDNETAIIYDIEPESGIIDGTPLIENGKLSVTIKNNASLDGKSVKIVVLVSGNLNYTDYFVEYTINVTSKAPQTITAADVTVTYGETGKRVEATNETTGGGAITYRVKSGNDVVDVDPTTGALTIKKAGTAVITVTAAETDTYAAATKDVTVTVNPKPVTAPTADDSVFTYNGSEQTYAIAENADYTITGNKQTNAGTYTVTVALKDKNNTAWATGGNADKTFNFVIGKASVAVTAIDQSIKVDDTVPNLSAPVAGTHYTVTGLVGSDELTTITMEYQLDGSAVTPDNTKTGTYDIVITTVDAGANYTVTTTDATLTISRRSTGGGGSSNNTYSIVVLSAENGTVTANKTKATKNETVTLMAKADQGYMLESLTVTTSSGSNVALTERGGGKYTFSMPASKVTVKATFVKRAAGTTSFLDISTDDYFYDAVLWAVEMGITDGTSETTFSPELGCTRAQMVTFLWRASGMPEATITETPFVDVDEYSYYYEALLWAYEVGVTDGTSETTFSPDEICTRGQMAAFMYRHDDKPAVSGDHPFEDVAVNDYYHNAVIWAFGEGITDGTSDNTFSPKNVCTRGQMVTFLYRFLAE